MILVDAGNTRIHFCWAKMGAIRRHFSLPTCQASLAGIKKAVARYPEAVILVCSVVPRVTALFKRLPGQVYIAGQDLKVPIQSLYNRKQIGMDRLVGALAAQFLYPDSRIIIDFGTAITFDFVSAQGVYQGGFILPGLGSTVRVLSGCAMLPDKIRLSKSSSRIPRNTAESISKGMSEGFSAMINFLVKKYKKQLTLSPASMVIITGGDGGFILKHLDFSYVFDQLLVFKGLLLSVLHRSNRFPALR